MEQIDKSRSSGHTYRFGYDRSPIEVTNKDLLVLRREGINFYFIDLKQADWGRIRNIVKECEEVEKACWKPQENFTDYLKKCDALSYAERDGKIIGFAAAHLIFVGDTCVYSNDETMVLKEFRNKRLALSLVGVPLEWFFARSDSFKETKHFVYTSVSSNPRVMNFYFKQSYCRTLFDCSFKPSPKLIAIKEEYCRKHNISLVNADFPFCLKNLFPGSNDFDAADPRFQFTKEVKANLPLEFDHMERGDAFAFMLKLPIKAARLVVFCIMARCFGKDYFTGKGLGYFSPKTQTIPVYAGRSEGGPAVDFVAAEFEDPHDNSNQGAVKPSGSSRKTTGASSPPPME